MFSCWQLVLRYIVLFDIPAACRRFRQYTSYEINLFTVDVPGSDMEMTFEPVQSVHLLFRQLEPKHVGILSNPS